MMIDSIPAPKFATHNPANNPANPPSQLPIIAIGMYNTIIRIKFNPIAILGLFIALNTESTKNAQPRGP